jgi:hypothetical protein
MKRIVVVLLVLAPPIAAFVGCSDNKSGGMPSGDGSKYLLSSEPADALGVVEARKKTKDGDDVVVVGRIGGRKDPWSSGQASFSIVDTSLRVCSEREGDNCDTPWDYCCEDPKELLAAMATVKIVDAKGEAVRTPARELLGVKESQAVVVCGKAKRDDKGNLTVLATCLYVRADNK